MFHFKYNVVIQTAQTFYQGEGTLLKDSDGSLTTMLHGKGCLRHKKTQTKKSGNFYYGDFNSGEISFKNGLNVFIEVQNVSERKITFSKGDLTFSLILEYKDLVKLNDKLDQLELLNFDETTIDIQISGDMQFLVICKKSKYLP